MEIKYGIIADTHGNLPALKKIYQTLVNNNCEKIIHIGDAIVKGPNPNECLHFLKENNVICTIGNHEEIYLEYKNNMLPPGFLDTRPHVKWTFENIDDKSYVFIKSMKKYITENINGLNLVFTHFGFNEKGQILYPININTYKNYLEETFKEFLPADIIFFAHTHERIFTSVNGTTYINPGAVGTIKDGYAKGLVLTIKDNKNFSINFLDIVCNKNELKEIFLNSSSPDKENLMSKFLDIEI